MSVHPLLKFEIRPVPSITGAFVSDTGVAYSRSRKQTNVLNARKASPGTVGYLVVSYPDGPGRSVPRYIHRMVGEAFLPPPKPGEEVRHLDGSRTNNLPSNLRWGTRLENVNDMRTHGTMSVGERHPIAKLTNETVNEIRWLFAMGARQVHICEAYDLSHQTVQQICARKTWRCV